MADNIELNSGSGGATIATDEISSVSYQRVKLTDGTADSTTVVAAGGGAEANALRVTLANDSTGVVSIDDNGGAITVDNGGTFAVQEDGAALTALQLIDDVVHADDAAFTLGTSKGVMVMGFAGTQSVNANDAAALACDTDGALHVSDGGNSLTVDGTVTANLSATDNAVLDTIETNLTDLPNVIGTDGSPGPTKAVSIGGTDSGGNFEEMRVDSDGHVQVDVVSAPSTAVTNVGTFAVQEDGAALTALQLIDDAVHADDAAFTLGTSKGVMMMGFAGTQSVDANDAGAIAMESDGAIHVHDGGNVLSVDDGGASLTVDNGGTFPTQIDGDALTALQLIDDAVHTDDAAFTLGTDKGVMIMGFAGSQTVNANDAAALACDVDGALHVADGGNSLTVDAAELTTLAGAVSGSEVQVDVVAALPAGTNAIGKLAANSGVDIGDVDVTSISAGSNLVGDVGISGARTSGGTTLYKNIDVDESEDQVKGTAGQVYWIHAMNLGSAARFLKLYNATAASVTVGTTVPDLTFPLATQGDTNGAGFVLSIPNGIEFDTAITIAATTGVADNDSGAPGANEVIVNLGYA